MCIRDRDEIAEKEIQNDEPEISNDSSEKMTVWYQGVPLEEWALTCLLYTSLYGVELLLCYSFVIGSWQ